MPQGTRVCVCVVVQEENQCELKFVGEGGESEDEKEGEEGVERAAQGGVGGGDEEVEEEEQEEEQEAYVVEEVEGVGDVFEEASLNQRRRCQNSSSDETDGGNFFERRNYLTRAIPLQCCQVFPGA